MKRTFSTPVMRTERFMLTNSFSAGLLATNEQQEQQEQQQHDHEVIAGISAARTP
jgi:hypothetical protein